MKQKILNFLSVITGFVLIGLVIFAIYFVAKNGWDVFRSLTENVQIAFSVAFLSLVSTIGSIIYSKVKEHKLQVEMHNIVKKQLLYGDFTDKIIEAIADNERGNDAEYMHSLRKGFIKNAILWANPNVVKAYHTFRLNTQHEGTGEQAMWDLATLFLEIRKDLGLKNNKIDQYTIAEILLDSEHLTDLYKRYPRKKQ